MRTSALIVIGALTATIIIPTAAHASTQPAVAGVATGIMSQGAPVAADGFIDSVVAPIRWNRLETSNQVFDGTDWAVMNHLIANPQVKHIRLRLYAGISAPDFVKQLGGPSMSGEGINCSVTGGIAVLNTYDSKGGCVPYFWTDEYLHQYRQIIWEIRRRYGSNPKFAEIADSACMTTYAEPFYRAHANALSNARLFSAGLNFTTDSYCEDQAMRIHRNLLRGQSISLAINNWDVLQPPATNSRNVVYDWSATKAFADKWRKALGGRLVLQNNGWGETDACLGVPVDNVYCYLKNDVRRPKGFQSETWSRLGDSGTTSLQGWYNILENAIQTGACFVESSDNQYKQADPAVLASYNQRLKANCP